MQKKGTLLTSLWHLTKARKSKAIIDLLLSATSAAWKQLDTRGLTGSIGRCTMMITILPLWWIKPNIHVMSLLLLFSITYLFTESTLKGPSGKKLHLGSKQCGLYLLFAFGVIYHTPTHTCTHTNTNERYSQRYFSFLLLISIYKHHLTFLIYCVLFSHYC